MSDHIVDAVTALLQVVAVMLGIVNRDKLLRLHRRIDAQEARERLLRSWKRLGQ